MTGLATLYLLKKNSDHCSLLDGVHVPCVQRR